MARLLVAFGLCVSALSAGAQFTVPPVDVQPLESSGLRVSIPDVPGIKLFGFHARINEPVGDKEDGSISGDVKEPIDGRWILEKKDVSLNKGDIIYYWIFVQHENVGFRRDSQSFTVNHFYPENTRLPPRDNKTPTCTFSKTTVNGRGNICKDSKPIFEDGFKNKLDLSKWTIEHKFPSNQQENEFVSYQKSNVKHVNQKIEIIPTLQVNQPDWDTDRFENDILDLNPGCTGLPDECISSQMDIIPPVVSGKITTKNKFSFKYGKIEVRAKFPTGDWIYPELYLEPASFTKYGNENYDSGVIRIAFARGNSKFEVGGQDLGNKLLSGGVVLSKEQECRNKYLHLKASNSPWSKDFHTYTVIWDSDKIELLVDGEKYGTINERLSTLARTCPKLTNPAALWKTGELIAPFDQEFYISLGVGMGGIADFPNVSGKPWKNEARKAKKDFWRAYTTWNSQWSDVTTKLTVEHVKVWSI